MECLILKLNKYVCITVGSRFCWQKSNWWVSTIFESLGNSIEFHLSTSGGTDYDTPYHLLCFCPRFAVLRHDLFVDIVLNIEEYQGLTLKKILSFLRESKMVL